MSFEESLATFALVEDGQAVQGIVVSGAAREHLSEYLGTDVAGGPAGVRWWDDYRGQRMMAANGHLVVRGGRGTVVYRNSEYTDSHVPDPPVEVTVFDFSKLTGKKCDAYALLHDLDDYPTTGSVAAKRKWLTANVNDVDEG